MKPDLAEELVGLLVGATTGWNDDSVMLYIRHMDSLAEERAAITAVTRLVNTWTGTSRPTWGAIRAEYDREVQREMMLRAGLPASTHGVVPVPEGRIIAGDAYVAECKRQGREPNLELFARMIGAIGPGEDVRSV